MDFRDLDDQIYELLINSLKTNTLPTEALNLLATYQEKIDQIDLKNELQPPSTDPITIQNADLILTSETTPNDSTPYSSNISHLLTAKNAVSPSLLLVSAAAASCPQDAQNRELTAIFGESAGQNFEVFSTFHEVLGGVDGAVEFDEFTRFKCGHVVPGSVIGDCPVCQVGRDGVYSIE